MWLNRYDPILLFCLDQVQGFFLVVELSKDYRPYVSYVHASSLHKICIDNFQLITFFLVILLVVKLLFNYKFPSVRMSDTFRKKSDFLGS